MKCQKEPDLSVGLCRHSLATNVYSFPSVAAAGTGQNKYRNFLERYN